jgi:hypothetical protein
LLEHIACLYFPPFPLPQLPVIARKTSHFAGSTNVITHNKEQTFLEEFWAGYNGSMASEILITYTPLYGL